MLGEGERHDGVWVDVAEEGVCAEDQFSAIWGCGWVVKGEDCDGLICAGDGDGVLNMVVIFGVGEGGD